MITPLNQRRSLLLSAKRSTEAINPPVRREAISLPRGKGLLQILRAVGAGARSEGLAGLVDNAVNLLGQHF